MTPHTVAEREAVEKLIGAMRRYGQPGFYGGVVVEVKYQNGNVTHIRESHEETTKLAGGRQVSQQGS